MHPARSSRHAEQGGMLIIVALMLLLVVTMAAFSLSRGALKELTTTGNVYQAGRAETASDGGIDWFVAWTSHALSEGVVAPDTKQATVTNTVMAMLDTPTHGGLTKAWKAKVGDGTDPFLLQGLSHEKTYTQAFDLQLEFLGAKGGDPAGGKNVRAFSTNQYAWELTSTGQALVKTGSGDSDYLRYRAVRATKLDLR